MTEIRKKVYVTTYGFDPKTLQEIKKGTPYHMTTTYTLLYILRTQLSCNMDVLNSSYTAICGIGFTRHRKTESGGESAWTISMDHISLDKLIRYHIVFMRNLKQEPT